LSTRSIVFPEYNSSNQSKEQRSSRQEGGNSLVDSKGALIATVTLSPAVVPGRGKRKKGRNNSFVETSSFKKGRKNSFVETSSFQLLIETRNNGVPTKG
jgi:hypothetical protein